MPPREQGNLDNRHLSVFMYDFHRGFGEECRSAGCIENLVDAMGYTFPPYCLIPVGYRASLSPNVYGWLRSDSGPESQTRCH